MGSFCLATQLHGGLEDYFDKSVLKGTVQELEKEAQANGVLIRFKELRVEDRIYLSAITNTGTGKIRSHISIFSMTREGWSRVTYCRLRNWKGKLICQVSGKHIEICDLFEAGEKQVLVRIDTELLDK